MTKVSTVHDALESIITTSLSTYSGAKLNPHSLELNPEVMLQKGYGIVYGPGSNTNRQVGCHLSVSRQFIVLLTNLVSSQKGDEDGREALEKALLEDCVTLIKAIEDNPSLSTTAGVGGPALSAQWVSDDGVEYLNNKNSSFMFCQLVFDIEYMESLE
jgi:hypothetical protein